MVLSFFKLLQVGTVVLVVLGATFSAIISNLLLCAKTLNVRTEECKNFGLSIGNTLFTPQLKIARGIDNLQPENLNSIPDSVKGMYINSVRVEIFFSLLVSLVHLWIIYKVLSILPAFLDLWVMLFIWIIAVGIWLSLQGFYASVVLHLPFLTPFSGTIKLITNLGLLFQISTQQAIEVGGEIASPV